MDRSFPNQDTRSFWGSQNFNAEVFARYEAPIILVSDRWKNFMSNWWLLYAIRYNSVISQCLRAYIDKEQNNWRKLLPSVLMSFRRSPCKESTQFRPTECSLEKRWIFLSIHKSFRRKPWVKMQTAFWRASSRIGEKNPAKQNVSQKREQTAATNNAKSKEPSFN